MPMGLGLGIKLTSSQGVGASAYASRPAPAGYHWEFVTFQGGRVTFVGVPVVALVGN